MIKRNMKRKCESVEDPRELFLSLVDMGSIDIEDAFLACVREMSDAECKRILNSISLPTGTELAEVPEEPIEEPELPEEPADDAEDAEDAEEVDLNDKEETLDSLEDESGEDGEAIPESYSVRRRRLESRLARLERIVRHRR